MIDKDHIDSGMSNARARLGGSYSASIGRPSINGCQIAALFLLFCLFSPALVTGRSRDWSEGLVLTLLLSPLLAWLFLPQGRSDDLFDESDHRRSDIVEILALILLSTRPLTCFAPLAPSAAPCSPASPEV
jgi:hypothetical protein